MEVIMKLDLLIMAEISKDLSRLWSINELATVLNKQYKPIYNAVQRLIKEDNLRKNSNNLIEPVFVDTILLELAEKKRFIEMTNNEIKIIKNKFEKIENSFFSVVLFGSSVYKKGIDIDILFILPDSYDTKQFNIKNALGGFYSKVDLNIITEKSCYEMLNKPNAMNVMNEIMKNHLVLIGVENFYRIIKRWKNGF